jgi:hypothetical protein
MLESPNGNGSADPGFGRHRSIRSGRGLPMAFFKLAGKLSVHVHLLIGILGVTNQQ